MTGHSQAEINASRGARDATGVVGATATRSGVVLPGRASLGWADV